MSFARIRLVVALLAFVGWLSYLGYAVSKHGTVQLVSRAHLTAASVLVVAKVDIGEDGRPLPTATVTQVLGEPAQKPAGVISVMNLPDASTPRPTAGGSNAPQPGEYLLALIKAGDGYRIAGLPRSPGYEAVFQDRPLIYPWEDKVQTQLRTLGLLR
jgi:hypothetical protein